MIAIAWVVVVAGAGLFSIFFVWLVSQRVLSRIGALVTCVAGMVVAWLVLQFCCGCAAFVPHQERVMIDWYRNNSRTVDTLR